MKSKRSAADYIQHYLYNQFRNESLVPWFQPVRSATEANSIVNSNTDNMAPKKVSKTLEYTSPGVVPPVFIAGSFSEPAWDPIEMEYTVAENGEHHFHKEILAEEGGNFQYKFRLGTGDWWALNESAPTGTFENRRQERLQALLLAQLLVQLCYSKIMLMFPIDTDDLGNRNNLLVVPITKETPGAHGPNPEAHGRDQRPENAASNEFENPKIDLQIPVPELVVEKVDAEPSYGDDFGPNATIAQKDAHEMRLADAEPDKLIIHSEASPSGTSTPAFARTAAEVADSAAMIDREATPAPVSDEVAGRTGMRRLSQTPIPQVALTAAEVADTAAILDKDDIEGDEVCGIEQTTDAEKLTA